MNKRVERITENKYGYSHYRTIYYTDGSYEMIKLGPIFKRPLRKDKENTNAL